MQIKLRDAEETLSGLVDSVLLNPVSWTDWHCLYIENPDLKEIFTSEERLIAVETMLESYLSNRDGLAVKTHDCGMFILSKSISENDLYKIGHHLNDFIVDFKTTEPNITVYDLYMEYDRFVHNVLKKNIIPSDHTYEPRLIEAARQLNDEDTRRDIHLTVKKKRVLVVEDDPIARWMVRKTLQDECMVAMASGVNKAFSAYQSYKPDIVFLDINLEDGSGYDVLQWIMRHDPGATVVMFSGSDDALNIARATEQGAKGFVPKPFIKDHLLEYIYSCPAR